MTPPPNRMGLLEADLASRSAKPRAGAKPRGQRSRARALRVDDGTPVSMSIGGRLPSARSAALTTPQPGPDAGHTVPPLLPAEPAAAPAPGTTPSPTHAPASPASPAEALFPPTPPATASPPSAAPPPPSATPSAPTKVARPPAKEDESFKEDLMTILASHRPDPASPPVPEPAPAPAASAPAEDAVLDHGDEKSAAQGHAVFDRLGKQMSTATTYDLGPLALERRLDELDQVIAAEVDTAEAARARADRVGTLRRQDDLLDVGEVAARLATPPPVSPSLPPVRRVTHDVRIATVRPGLTCGAAAAASLVAWRDRLDPASDELPAGAGPWTPYADGRQARSAADLAAWGLTVTTAATAGAVFDALEAHGPLWLAASPPGEHAVVVSSATSDGTDTRVTVMDPCSAEAAPLEQSWSDLRSRVGAADGLPLTLAHLTTS